MAYARINNGKTFLNKIGGQINEGSFFLADTIEDLLKIEYNDIKCPVGSIALVLGYKEGNNYNGHPEINLGGGEAASDTFIMNPSKHWVRVTGSANIMA